MKKIFLFGMAAVMMAACEKPVIEDPAEQGHEAGANVVMRFSAYQQQDFTRALTQLTDQCSRLSVAVFKSDGTKVKSVNQTSTDGDFGTVAVSLAEGTYKVVAVAHSSTEGNATITSTEKVTFASNKMTDTFSYYGTLTVVDGSAIDEELQMQRVVAMVRLTVSGTIPQEVQRFKFYYTGGSSTLNPATGYGCVNSKQTEYRYTVVDGSAVNTFDLYTAPHEQNDALKLTITALDAEGQAMNEWTMENVPVTRNKITTWTGALFSDDGTGGSLSDGGLSLTLDTTWGGTLNYTW